jgi:hypothetical protein
LADFDLMDHLDWLWLRRRLDDLASYRAHGLVTDAERAEFDDLCDAEAWFLTRAQEARDDAKGRPSR